MHVKDEILELKISNINIYNVLASLAVLKELDLDIKKTFKYLKIINLQKEEVKYIK